MAEIARFEASGESYVVFNAASDNQYFSPKISYLRARGTVDAPTNVQGGDNLMDITTSGYYGGANQWASTLGFDVKGTPSGTNVSSKFYIQTRSTTGAMPMTRLTVTPIGRAGIGTETPGYPLDVVGGPVAGLGAYVNTSDARLKINIEPLHVIPSIIEAIKTIYSQIENLFTRTSSHDERIKQLEAENVALKTYLCNKDAAAPFCEQPAN